MKFLIKPRARLLLATFVAIGFAIIPITGCFMPSSINSTLIREEIGLRSSDGLTNQEILQAVFDELDSFYSTNAYYPETWDGSIRSDYYAVYIANSLGKLAEVDTAAVKTHLMSFYNPATNVFVDEYARRYLDTDFDLEYYPYCSLLETNCYAVLTLQTLGELGSINCPEMIDFIWSCYDSSTGGFIGQPYSPTLSAEFRLPTADNTYFAVIALNTLMGGDWSFYSDERAAIISFVASLQHPSSPIGFFNDQDYMLDTLVMLEPNLIASYYCVRVLDAFNSLTSMNLNQFQAFLSLMYDSESCAFDLGVTPAYATECNVVATAMGLELSILTNFAGCDQDGVFQFLVTQLNAYTLWDASTTVKYHELIDTFQVMRSLNRAGRLDADALTTLDPLVTSLNFLFWNGASYSLLAKDFTSQRTQNAIVSAYHAFDNMIAMDVNEVYKDVKDSFKTVGAGTSQFSSSLYNNDPEDNLFRSFPIEHYCIGTLVQVPKLERMYTQKSMFYALDTLDKLYKLDLFAPLIDQDQFIVEIVASQFLDETQENYGAFLDSSAPMSSNPAVNNKFAFFEYSYYAIRALELLASISPTYGSILDVGIDTTAFYEFVSENLVQTSQVLYFEFPYSLDALLNLKNTYFACYALKALGLYELDDAKIKAYVDQTIDYGSVESVYYSYELLTLIDQSLDFDIPQIHQLVQDAYDPIHQQFYLTNSLQKRDWQAFAWICEMAATSDTQITAQYLNDVYLGGTNSITATFSNLILDNPFQPDEVKYESLQLGVHPMALQPDGSYWVEVTVPIDAANYPVVAGSIKAYEAGTEVMQKLVEFTTTYGVNQISVDFSQSDNVIDISADLSFLTGVGEIPMSNDFKVRLSVVIDGALQPEEPYLAQSDFDTYSRFTTQYTATKWGSYSLNLFLVDDIAPKSALLKEYSFTLSENIDVIAYPQSGEKVRLGDTTDFAVEFFDQTLQKPVYYEDVSFISPELGAHSLTLQPDGTYSKPIGVPLDKSFYPQITGTIEAKNGTTLYHQVPVVYDTYYELKYTKTEVDSKTNIQVNVECWFETDSGHVDMFDTAIAVTKIIKDGEEFANITFPAVAHHGDYSEYKIAYDRQAYGNHTLEVCLNTEIGPSPDSLFIKQFTYEGDVRAELEGFETCKLGSNKLINVNYYDEQSETFLTYDDVVFISDAAGSATLTLVDDRNYQVNFVVPVSKTCYPVVSGQIIATRNGDERKDALQFNTTYEINYRMDGAIHTGAIVITCEGWLVNSPDNLPLLSTTEVEADIAFNQSVLEDPLLFTLKARDNFSEFSATYAFEEYGTYAFSVKLFDPFEETWLLIGDPITVKHDPDEDPEIIVYDDQGSEDGGADPEDDSEGEDDPEDVVNPDNSTSDNSTSPDDLRPGDDPLINPQAADGLPMLIGLVSLPVGGLLVPVVNGVLKHHSAGAVKPFRKRKR